MTMTEAAAGFSEAAALDRGAGEEAANTQAATDPAKSQRDHRLRLGIVFKG